MTQLLVTTRRMIDVPDDRLVFNAWHIERDIRRIDGAATVEGLLHSGETLVDVYLQAEMVIAPDPDEQKDYELALRTIASEKRARDLKLLAGVLPDELPTDEEIEADYLDDPAELPTMTLVCGNCGSNEFEYGEGAWCVNKMSDIKVDADGGQLQFWGHADYSEGDGHPGVTCSGCDAQLSMPDGVEIEWSS